MKNRKILSILLAVFALTFFSCENWMKDDNLYSDIEYDVKVANAAKIQVFTRYAMTSQGSTSPNGYSTFKVGIPQEVSATTDTNYGFVRWAAFSTTYLDTIDQQKNENVIYNSVTEYEENILPNEITAPTVVFENPTSPSTKVTINQSRGDIFIVPLVTARPKVNGTIPDDRETDVVRNSAVRINFTKEMDYDTLKNGISITQGSWVEREDGLYYDYEDISNRFNDPRISSNKKLITFSFAPAYIKTGFDQSAKVTVTISKEVKDVFGFSMVEDEKFVFTPGGTMDSRAPRITQLTGGWKTQFGDFQGMYAYSGTADSLGNKTKIVIKEKGSKNAPDTLNEDFYTGKFNNSITQPFIMNRVGNKVSLRVFAEDLNKEEAAGVVNQEKDEKGVKWVSVRARRLFKNGDGSYYGGNYTDITEKVYSQKGNPAKIGTTSQGTPTYEALVTAAGFTDEDAKNVGCLFEYDLSDLEDGLIQIDVAAEDNVGNNGFYEDEAISNVNGNGYASIFVVKDTTVPTGLVDGGINITVNGASFAEGNYYNRESFENFVVNLTDSVKSSISDAGDSRLSSKKNDIKWTIIQIDDDVTSENLLEQFSGDNVVWKSLDGTIQNEQNSTKVFVAPDEDKADGIRFAYAIKDDMDNINPTIFSTKALYDCTAPVIGELSWIADSGSAAGLASGEEINNQTLVIPVTDETSKLKSLEILIKPVDEHGVEGEAYAAPFAGSGLAIYKNDTKTQFETSEYTRNGNKVTLNGTYNGIEKILIKGLKIADNLAEGKYNVYVKAYDAAGNVETSAPIALSNDSTLPVIEKIYIPDIKKFVRVTDSSNTPEYWIDAHCGNLKLVNTYPVAKKVFITFKENNSGAQIFNFADSSMKLTASSKVYKVDTNLQIDGDELSCSFDLTNNKFTLDNPLVSQGDSFITIAITDVQLAAANSALKLVITDKATNQSIAKDTITSDSVSDIVSFRYEAISPAIPGFNLEDQEAEGNTAQTPVPAAIDGFTNSTFVKATVTVTPRTSGFSELTIISKAKFDDTTVIKDITSSPAISIAYDIVPGTDNKTIRFKKTVGSEDVAAIVGVSSGDNRILEITNLKLIPDDLNNPDGIYIISIKGKSAAEVQATFKTDTITLDTIPPEWGSTKGLYTAEYPNKVTPANVYPHPKPDKSSEGITFPGSDDLYFYRSSYIRIDPKVVDSNPRLDGDNLPIVRWTGPGITNYSDYSYFFGRYTGDFTVTIYDKAGNASPVRNFHVVNVTNVVTSDNSRKNIGDIENDVELVVPDGVDKAKNTFLNGVRTIIESNLYAYNYVLKKVDGNYQLKIPLHSYAAANVNTAPIEQYGVSYYYRCYPSTASDCATDSYIPKYYPNNLPSDIWNEYGTGSQPTEAQPAKYEDLYSYIDSNGDIIVTLPQHYCHPVSLLLKDGCGNMTFILLNPGLKDKLGNLTVCEQNTDGTIDAEKVGLRNQAVSWVFDDSVGVSAEHAGTENLYNTTDTVITTTGDVIFYNNTDNKTPLLKLENCSDIVRFAPSQTGVGNSDNYTMKSRLIVWENNNAQGTNPPKQSDFEAATAVGSDWYYYKEFYNESSTASSAFTLQNSFPEYDNDTHETSAYELWYIVEDRVGNANIKQITYKNADNVSKVKWMYDVTPPKLNVTTANKVNYIADEDTNYWSSSSTVKYTISDKQSGIANDGADTVYSPINPVYELNEKDLSLENATQSGDKLYVNNVEDWAGNKVTSKGLENHGSFKWIKQSTPTITNVTALIKAYKGSSETEYSGGITESEGHTSKAPKIKIRNDATKIKITLAGNNDLMGWLLDPVTVPTEADFHSVDDTQIKKGVITINKPQDGWVEKTHKLYAVNKAGLACITAFEIVIESNEAPRVNPSGITYTNITEYKENGTLKQYYIKSDSEISFTTTIPIKLWKLYYGTGDNDFVTEQYTTKKSDITIDLATKLSGKTIQSTNIYLVLDSGSEISTPIYLKDNQNNKWTYDVTKPSITIASVKAPQNGDAISPEGGVYYINADNAYIQFTSDNDTAKYMCMNVTAQETEYSDISVTNNVYTISVTNDITEYSFVAVDKAGNQSTTPVTVKLKKDTTGPSGSVSYKVYKGSVEATKLVDGATSPADYIETVSGSTSTIKYNPLVVTKFVINGSNISDSNGVGLPTNFLFYRKSGGSDYTQITGGEINLTLENGSYLSGKIYIYAKDKLGNLSDKLWTFELTPYSTAPAAASEKTDAPYSYLFDDTNSGTFATYNNNRINGFGSHTSFTISPDPVDVNLINDSAHQDWGIRAIAQESTITLPIKAKNNLITNKVYYKLQFYSVQHRPSSPNFAAPTSTSDWSPATVDLTKDIDVISVTVTPAQVVDRNTFIFIWLKDELGNISVYNIPYPSALTNNWWTADTTGPAGSVEYALKKDSADGSNYTVSTSGSTVTVTYNHALGFVNKLTLTPTLNDSDGVGVDGLYYKKGDNALQKVSDNSISLDDSYSTYEIYAKDKLGNQSALLKKFIFVKDDTAPDGTVSFTPKQNGTEVTQSSTTYTLTQSGDKYTLTYVKTESTTTVDSVTIAFTNTSSDLKSITMQVNANTQTFTNGTYDFNISSITSKQTFNIVATDNCGNTKTWQLELDPVAALPGNGEGGGTNPNRISTSPFSGNIDTSALIGGSAPAAAQGPGITINNNMNFEVPAVVAGSAGTSRAAKKAAKKAAKAAKAAEKQTPVVQEIAAQVEEIAELTEIAEITEISELATPVAKDQLAMVLPKTANTKQIETQVSVETSLVETTSDTYEETVHDDLVFKLIVAIASLVLCGVFGLTMLLKRKRA